MIRASTLSVIIAAIVDGHSYAGGRIKLELAAELASTSRTSVKLEIRNASAEAVELSGRARAWLVPIEEQDGERASGTPLVALFNPTSGRCTVGRDGQPWVLRLPSRGSRTLDCELQELTWRLDLPGNVWMPQALLVVTEPNTREYIFHACVTGPGRSDGGCSNDLTIRLDPK
jgi:hypothetical protein